MQRETKKLIYKLAGGLASPDNLQNMVKRLIEKCPKPDDRLETLGVSDGEVRFINLIRQHHGVTFGTFHKVTKGEAHLVIEMAGDQWEVAPVTAKSAKRPHGEFIEGTLFFGIFKNHIVLHQTMSCRAEQFEGYLNWLAAKLHADGGGAGNETPLISLDDTLPKRIRQKDSSPVKHITIASGLESKPISSLPAAQSASLNFTPSGGAWDGIKSILAAMKIPLPDEILLDGALDVRDLRVRLELFCTKKKAESSAGEVLGKLGHALRNSDGNFYSVELTDGTVIKGDDIKIEKGFPVDCQDKLPIPESMFKTMLDFFHELVENQTIIEQEKFGNVK
jgi:hypothetical protein